MRANLGFILISYIERSKEQLLPERKTENIHGYDGDPYDISWSAT